LKGIVLAGGSGTRLYPVTEVVSKQLMPVYDKPMIYYPLSTLLLAGLKEILIISTPRDTPLFKELLGTGEQWGIKLSYVEQPKPEGLAQSLILAEDFLEGSTSCLILGDNIFHGHGFSDLLRKASDLQDGALIFGYRVKNPTAYGVVEFDNNGCVIGLEEKPVVPKSKYAVPGIYFFDQRAPKFARSLKPSHRGEIEITDLNLLYLEEGSLRVEIIDSGYAWLDTGTHENLLQASNFVHTIIERQGVQIGCLEEIAFEQSFIDEKILKMSCEKYHKTNYGHYLKQLISSCQ
jgi:glucose-1-phosphate thymidylyltransferase